MKSQKASNVTGGEMSRQCFVSAELNIIRFQTSTGSYQTHSSNVIMTGPLLKSTVLSASSLGKPPSLVFNHVVDGEISCLKLNAADQCYQHGSMDARVSLSGRD